MLRVGLTGGIGSGKSTVARRLSELGAVVVDADVIAREVVAPGTPGLAAVSDRFGAGVIAPDGSLDRAALGALVFADAQALQALESITHPLVAARAAELIADAEREEALRLARGEGPVVLVHDVPLLVEKGMAGRYDLVVVVEVAGPERLRRLVARGHTESDARARVAAQASDEQRRAVADVVIDNSGSIEATLAAVDALWRETLLPRAERLTGAR